MGSRGLGLSCADEGNHEDPDAAVLALEFLQDTAAMELHSLLSDAAWHTVGALAVCCIAICGGARCRRCRHGELKLQVLVTTCVLA
eukprot:2201450-Amphidinium_carterae.1